MTLFQKDWHDMMVNDVSPAIDRHLGGETLRIVPTVQKPNMPAVPDYSKAITVRGIFDYRAKMVLTSNNVPVETREPEARFGYYVLGGFQIKHTYRIEREDGTLYEVTAVKPDGVSSVCCDLKQLGRAPGK